MQLSLFHGWLCQGFHVDHGLLVSECLPSTTWNPLLAVASNINLHRFLKKGRHIFCFSLSIHATCQALLGSSKLSNLRENILSSPEQSVYKLLLLIIIGGLFEPLNRILVLHPCSSLYVIKFSLGWAARRFPNHKPEFTLILEQFYIFISSRILLPGGAVVPLTTGNFSLAAILTASHICTTCSSTASLFSWQWRLSQSLHTSRETVLWSIRFKFILYSSLCTRVAFYQQGLGIQFSSSTLRLSYVTISLKDVLSSYLHFL